MNKITPHLLRDLDSTLPRGTECYLRPSARAALAKYRNGKQPASFVGKEAALPLLTQGLGRGLKRFLIKEVRAALPAERACSPERMA
ncbi:hypothetical protein NP590_07200 [Methylomonas sp. SURF-2]|uniref:Uncharacterized protein n=1 Tax=Methylomonas subterranea TaxID=2952225 RepID=A0ABT1TEJ9_9GAMM|nr:hypothetical protein [Methylomonas sp. SURF-2]MCQ8103886.1 hypothetical protein [Methylomonas sp. SURF-2]